MEVFNFDDLLKHSKKREEKKSLEALNLSKFLSQLNDYIQNLKKDYPDLNMEKLNEIFEKDYFELADAIFSSSYIVQDSMEYECCNYFLENRDKFNDILENIDSFNVEEKYSTNFESNLIKFVSDIKKDYADFMNSECFQDDGLILLKNTLLNPSISNSEKRKFCNSCTNKLSYNAKKDFLMYVDCIKNSEFGFLKYRIKDLEKNLKDNLVESISLIATQLDKYGFLEKYAEYQTDMYSSKLGLSSNFTHKYNSTTSPCLLSLKSVEFLRLQDLSKLLVLNNFWINKFVKELDTYAEGMYVSHQLNLFQSMLDSSFNCDKINIEDIKQCLLKMNLFYIPTNAFWKEQSNILSSSDIETQNKVRIQDERLEGKNYTLINHSKFLDDFEVNYKENYDKEFPGSDLRNDLDLYWKYYNPVFNAYSVKDANIISLLSLSNILSSSFNYGVVLPQNSNIANSNLINFWADFVGFNFPLRIHIPKMTLTKFLKDFNSTTIVPIYSDYEAFDDIKSHILLPFSKSQISFIKSQKSNNYQNYRFNFQTTNFLEHSNYLINPKKFNKLYEKKYVALSTGKIFKLDEAGKYIPENSSNDYER